MSEHNYDLSDKILREEFETLVFKKAMAIRCEEESKKIFDELQKEGMTNQKEREKRRSEINRLISIQRKKRIVKNMFSASEKVFTVVSIFFFVIILSLSSVVVASADVREYVKETLYHLVYEDNELYTKVTFKKSEDFIDPELYDWDGAYAPTYIPDGYAFCEKQGTGGQKVVKYKNNQGQTFTFIQSGSTVSAQIDTENADIVEELTIGDNIGLLVVKGNRTTIIWSSGEVVLSLRGTCNTDEIIKVALNIKLLK